MSRQVSNTHCDSCGHDQTVSAPICNNCGIRGDAQPDTMSVDRPPRWGNLYWNESTNADGYRSADICPECMKLLKQAFPKMFESASIR